MPDPADRRLALAQRLLSWGLLVVGTVYAMCVLVMLAMCLRARELPPADGLRRFLLYPLAGAVVALGGGLYLRRSKPWSG